ncbi:cytochrome b6-f complex iron-sulfur subunit [bacterium BMS3Abin05]|nr:cytochrome b6-f complex iron-sulfur subunit [bacterium BMS3Abin05]GBE27260.1 cytochrome b6-f complex iron-sulfur subunit [bacterium BMS3Bbin03]
MVDKNTGDKEEKTGITRRKFTLGVILASVAGAFGSLLALLKVLSPEKKGGGGYVSTIKPGDKLVYAKGGKQGDFIKVSSLNIGDAVLAYPAGKASNPANIVQLIKLKESTFKPPTHINLTGDGLVAYSAICTHLGCIVSWVRNQQSPDTSFTECFCHDSIFDPLRGAKVLSGPAPIPLAQIGIKVEGDGTLVFTSGFTGPIGPQV